MPTEAGGVFARSTGVGRVAWRAARVGLLWLGAVLALYVVFVRPWHLGWGATEAEIARRMPGDDLVQSPDFDATRAVEIAAARERVWPILVRNAGDFVERRGDTTGAAWTRLVEPGEWMVWWDRAHGHTWAWGLYPAEGGGTRLVTRHRARHPSAPTHLVHALLGDVTDVLALRVSLLEIKRQAEAGTAP